MTTRRRILCVDDHQDTCALITTLLSDSDVSWAHDKASGLQKAETENFDLYLLDYCLPDGTGLQLCKLIRTIDEQSPILLVTGTSMITTEHVLLAGGQGVIYKRELVQRLAQVVAELDRRPLRSIRTV